MPGELSCPHCGRVHATTCSRIRRIEYAEDGVTLRAIEFHPPAQALSIFPDMPRPVPSELWGPGTGPISNE